MVKRTVSFIGFVLLFLSFVLPVVACDENHGSTVRIQAPIESKDCEGEPRTITLLGLKIDMSAIKFEEPWTQIQCEYPTCEDLEPGQTVKVVLASDAPDPSNGLFIATEFEPRYWGEDIVKIAAPLQEVGETTVTILGLSVDISSAKLMNDEEEPIIWEKLSRGQFARIVLDKDLLPELVATWLMVHVDEIKVWGPIKEADCASAPQTITVLGLKIDVSSVDFQKMWGTIQCEYPTCEDLEPGQIVKVELASDIPDLGSGLFTATELRPGGCRYDHPRIIAPLQGIDLGGQSVTVLGLPVDVSEAALVDDNEKPITLDKLGVGQFVELDIDSPDAPLVATRLEAQSPISQVEIKLLDKKKRPMRNLRDVRADVTIKGMKKALSVQNAGNGTLLVAGLPQGRAKIAVTCTQDGKTVKGSASVKVQTRSLKQVSLRLKPVK